MGADIEVSNEDLIVRAKAGDDLAYAQLIEQNQPLIMKTLKKYLNHGVEHEELMSIGKVGLVKAFNNYNPDKGYKYVTLASRCILNEAISFMKLKVRWDKEEHLDNVARILNEKEITFLDIIPDRDSDLLDDIINDEDKMRMSKAFSKLTGRDKEVLEYRYVDCLSAVQTGEIMNFGRKYIYVLENKALEKLEVLFNKEYGFV